jgi:hypothetical protein
MHKFFFLIPIAVIIAALAGLFIYQSTGEDEITHDGNRTGPRVSYSSYCDPEGGYVIYENEKVPFTTNEGLQVFWTKDDVECYKRDILADKTEKFSPAADSYPIVNCLISKECGGGSKQLKLNVCKSSTCCQRGGKWIC